MSQLTTRKAAQILGVSEASIKRWCDCGRIGASKTPGGHRRLSEQALMDFVKENKYTLAHPELLTMSVVSKPRDLVKEEGQVAILEALRNQDKASLHAILKEWFYCGYSLDKIFDQVAAPVFQEIGCLWAGGELDVAQERAACTLFHQVLIELSAVLKPKQEKNLHAVGGALTGDWYTLPGTMVDLVLREQGWQSLCLGGHLPAESLVNAIKRHRPNLFWLSVSHVQDQASFLRDQAKIAEACTEMGCFLIMGGQALTAELRKKMAYSVYCDTLTHMTTLLKRIFEDGKS